MVECKQCGTCCRQVSVAMDTPEDKEDWDELIWMLHHENINVYLDNEDDWCVEFRTPCKHLMEDNRCGIYENRPNLCREHSAEECEMHGEGETYKLMFRSAEELMKYLDEKNIDYTYEKKG